MRLNAALVSALLGIVLVSAPAHAQLVQQSDTVIGFTRPSRESDLGTAEPGLLAELSVKPGQQVDQGQVLGTLDNAVLLVALEIASARAEASGRIEAARAGLALRQNKLDKIRRLADSGNARPDELTLAETELKIAAAELRSRNEERRIQRLEVAQIKAQIRRRELRSPFAGLVLEAYREIGERVGIGADAAILRIAQLNPLEVEFHLPAKKLDVLTLGANVSLSIDDVPGPVPATVSFLGAVYNPDSDTVVARVEVENSDYAIKSGLRCILTLPSATPNQIGVQDAPAEP